MEVDGHRNISNYLRQMPGVEVHQYGSAERTFLFPVDLFPEVARVVRSHKVPRRTPSQLGNLRRGSKLPEKVGVMGP